MPAKGALGLLTVASVLQTAAITAEGLEPRFGSLGVLDGVDLEVRTGEVVAVVGPSGCGKSTLLELFAGLQEPDAGRVSAAGSVDAADRLRACAFMPQRDPLLP